MFFQLHIQLQCWLLGKTGPSPGFQSLFILDCSFLHFSKWPFLIWLIQCLALYYIHEFLYKEHPPDAWPGSAESRQAYQEKWHAVIHAYFSFLRWRGIVSQSLGSSVWRLLSAHQALCLNGHVLSWVRFYVFSISKEQVISQINAQDQRDLWMLRRLCT